MCIFYLTKRHAVPYNAIIIIRKGENMYYTETYKIKKDLEKEKFLRESLVNLSLCGVKDIYKSKFVGVEETNCKYTIFYYSICS